MSLGLVEVELEVAVEALTKGVIGLMMKEAVEAATPREPKSTTPTNQ